MAQLSVAIIGLGRIGTSFGLSLKRHTREENKYSFDIVGFDISPDNAKHAQKMGAVDSTVPRAKDVVEDKDIVIIAISYDEVENMLKQIAPALRVGAVVLDASPLKQPSIQWAEEYFGEDNHLIGITPLVNPKYIFKPQDDTQMARDDMFDESSIILSPASSAIKEAVDLAFNLCTLIGSRPRFLDPSEHDVMLTQTVGLPRLIGFASFYHLMTQDNWHDMQWFTNPEWGVLTLPLRDVHPDALRDEWMNNPDILTRSIDGMIETLQQVRELLQDDDKRNLETTLVSTAEQYEKWLNHRYKADWDDYEPLKVDASHTLMGSIFGGAIAKRLRGDRDDDK